MILYSLKSGLCLGLLYSVYKLLLEREKMALFNRWFLLFGLLCSFIIPLISIEQATTIPILEPISIDDMMGLNIVPKQVTNSSRNLDWLTLLYACYGVVVCLLLIRFIYHLNHLYRLVSQNAKIGFRGVKLVLLKENILPYTFCQYIFVSSTAHEQGQIEEELYTHELTHAHQWHSIDVLTLEFLQIFFWFNPLLFFYKRAIQLNHEFLADDEVIRQFQKVSSYQHLLLEKITSNQSVSLTSNLNFLLTKKRLKMMTKSTSWFRACSLVSITIPLFFALLFLFSNSLEAQTTTKSQDQVKDDYFQHTTFVCTKKSNKKIYKPYADLTKKEKSVLPPPPKTDGNKKLTPLPEGTVVYLGEDDKVTISFANANNIPPPPPAPPVPSAHPSTPPVPPAPPVPSTPPSPVAPNVAATPAMIKEFNTIAKKYNNQSGTAKKIQMEDLMRLMRIRKVMSAEQIKKAEPFPTLTAS